MKLCSACLLGVKCRYDERSKLSQKVIDLAEKEILIPVCPEQMGGLSTPREPAEQKGNKVITKSGKDVTESFTRGAEEVLRLVEILNIKEAVLKQKSPSCGCGKVYDGSFSHKIIKGDGVTTKLLKENGVKVVSEDDLQTE